MPRPVSDQVVVAGASSDVGRENALLLAARDASLALTARKAPPTVAADVSRPGGDALARVTAVVA